MSLISPNAKHRFLVPIGGTVIYGGSAIRRRVVDGFDVKWGFPCDKAGQAGLTFVGDHAEEAMCKEDKAEGIVTTTTKMPKDVQQRNEQHELAAISPSALTTATSLMMTTTNTFNAQTNFAKLGVCEGSVLRVS
uniref:Uncharacterized protein n=1 Tax=Globodera rostochiensis TaxID=31243 RepID=A0A914HML3_GLORO